MREPTFPDAFEVLCLQAADNGRGPVLFGDCVNRARSLVRPFIVGAKFPSIYLEFPLSGDPFLDVTVLLNRIEPGTRVDSPAATGTGPLLDWYASIGDKIEEHNVCCGFELDTGKSQLPRAAVHFQPREHTEHVEPFFKAIGEPDRAQLYLSMAERMPAGWKLSFLGLFRGRSESPLRVCGYLSSSAKETCARNPQELAATFDQIGFSAYDAALLDQAAELIGRAPHGLDFQFDVFPDGSLGDTFAIDTQFEVEQPEAVEESFNGGSAESVMALFERWGIADDRWRLIPDAAFARFLPVERADGTSCRFSFTLMPGWAKARWRNATLQPAKFYFLAKAGAVERKSE